MEWPNGATGTFISSTGETPGTNRFEIVGTLGKLVLENNQLTFTRNEADMIEFSRTATQGFAKPNGTTEQIPIENTALPHAVMVQNFVDAILDGKPLIAPGEEGIHSVELANAMIYSSLLGDTLELPMDGIAWEAKLNQLMLESKLQKKVVAVSGEDFASSFRK